MSAFWQGTPDSISQWRRVGGNSGAMSRREHGLSLLSRCHVLAGFMIVSWNGRRLFDDQDGQPSLRQRLTGGWRKCGSSIPILLDASDSGSGNSPLKITSASAAIRWPERLAYSGRELSSKLAEGALYASHRGLPVASGCLPEESHRRIPGAIVAIEHPTPVRRERQ